MILYSFVYCIRGPGSSVGIATELRAGRSRIDSRWGRDFRPSRPALWPTEPPVQWVPGLSRGRDGLGVGLTSPPPSKVPRSFVAYKKGENLPVYRIHCNMFRPIITAIIG